MAKPTRKRHRRVPIGIVANEQAASEFRWFAETARAPRLRTMLEFAEEEIVIPSGPFEGRRFKCDRQPYSRLWYHAVDSSKWNRFVVTGPSQSGKTLSGYVIPCLYHLFEIRETVILGLPDMDMAADKWEKDILPVIRRTRYADRLPASGRGSRGGKIDSITFRDGQTLKFMSGGGGDKSRAHYTARVLIITETDGLDESSETSVEADKVTQMEARTRAYAGRRRVYMECTVSVARGRTWREYKAGTKTCIVCPCPHCKSYVTPEREHLLGWKEADNKIDAGKMAYFVCPSCEKPLTDLQRIESNRRAMLLHRGQTIKRLKSGRVTIEGDMPKTDTLGFRWSAYNNLFWSPADIGRDEWKASRELDEENAEREMTQFVWATPYEEPTIDLTPLDAQELMRRTANLPRGIAPTATKYITCHIDLGKFLAHYMVIAWSDDATGHIVDYSLLEIPTKELGVEPATRNMLLRFRDLALSGWACKGEHSGVPDQVWIDIGWKDTENVALRFCKESGTRFRPAIGRGHGNQRMLVYNRPKTTGAIVKHIGEGYHLVRMKTHSVHVVEVDANYWKSWVHERLAMPSDSPGAMTIFDGPPTEHMKLAKHLTAERRVEEFDPEKGTVVKWVRVRRANHHLDNLYNCAAAAHLCGARVDLEKRVIARARPDNRPTVTTPDGRPFLVSER